MASTQPSEDNISQFMDITTHGRSSAIEYLRGTNNDLWKAIDMAINGEPPNQIPQSSMDWSEADWGSDRNGAYDNGNIPSFQIDVPDEIPQYSHSVAPSRPPSRNSQRSAASRNNQADVPASGRQSRMDTDQETGLINNGNSAPYFGPATRSHYDASDWALTISDVHTKDDGPPENRKRQPGHLAFLKPSQSKDCLPMLLTILDTIPLAHNALLLSAHVATDYGYDSEWWRGASIESTAAVVLNDPSVSMSDIEIVHETQRLIAFLDTTDRAYGSAEALTRLNAMAKITHSSSAAHLDLSTDFEKFLAAWQAAATKVAPTFNLSGILSTTATVHDQHHRFPVLPANLGKDMPYKPHTIYDVLDAKIFIEEWPNVEDDIAVISEPAQVFILKLHQPDASCEGLDLEVPAVWYADRYLQENLAVTKDLRQHIAHSKALIQRCDEHEQELSKYDHNGKQIDPFKLIEASMKAFRPRTTEEKEVFPRSPEEEAEEEARYHGILKQLQKALDTAREKLNELKVEKEHTIEQLRHHSNLLTDPTDGSEVSPKFRYRLRGVTTKPDVAYVLQPTAEVAAKDEDWTEQAQWWKIECFYVQSKLQYMTEQTTQSEVLKAARKDSKDVTLVYATDAALEHPLDSLPAPLENFVRRDNHAFKQELQQAEATQDSYWGNQGENSWENPPEENLENPPKNDWDSSWTTSQPPAYDDASAYAQKWGETYSYEKQAPYKEEAPDNNTASAGSGRDSSNESGQVTLTPDTETTETEMKEKEGSSLVGEMMSNVPASGGNPSQRGDSEMADAAVNPAAAERHVEAVRQSSGAKHIENTDAWEVIGNEKR